MSAWRFTLFEFHGRRKLISLILRLGCCLGYAISDYAVIV